MITLGIIAIHVFLAPSSLVNAKSPDAKAKNELSAVVRRYQALELAEASQGFSQLLTKYPNWKTAAGFRAACRFMSGDNAGAASDAKIAAKIQPNDALSYAARGRARFIQKNYTGASADFKAASDSSPKGVEGPLGMASVLSAQGKATEALSYANRAVQNNSQCAMAYYVRAGIEEQLKNFQGAVDDYSAVIGINSKFLRAIYLRGKAYREISDNPAAEKDLTLFIESNPEFIDAIYTRSNVRFLLNNYQGAVEDLTKVISLSPRKGIAYLNRGLIRAKMGLKQEALMDLNKALELDPSRRGKIQDAILKITSAESSQAAQNSTNNIDSKKDKESADDHQPRQKAHSDIQ